MDPLPSSLTSFDGGILSAKYKVVVLSMINHEIITVVTNLSKSNFSRRSRQSSRVLPSLIYYVNLVWSQNIFEGRTVLRGSAQADPILIFTTFRHLHADSNHYIIVDGVLADMVNFSFSNAGIWGTAVGNRDNCSGAINTCWQRTQRRMVRNGPITAHSKQWRMGGGEGGGKTKGGRGGEGR